MTARLHLALCALILVFGIGCTNVRSTVNIHTQRFDEIPKGKTYSFDTGALNEGSLQHELYYAQIEKHLAKIGWHRLPNDDRKADYSVELTYNPVRNHTPPNSSTGRRPSSARTLTTTQMRSSTPAPQSSGNISMVSFPYKLDLSMIRRAPKEEKRRLVTMWEASVLAGSASTEGPQVIPVMIDALFKKFPGKTDYNYVITSPVKD